MKIHLAEGLTIKEYFGLIVLFVIVLRIRRLLTRIFITLVLVILYEHQIPKSTGT
jgi:hypothetical protein